MSLKSHLGAGVIALGLTTLGAAGPAMALPNATHAYGLNGSYADELGGAPAVPVGGVLGKTALNFNAGQGLSLNNALGASTYSIEMRFKLKTVTSSRNSYVRLIDWLDRRSDTGLYVYDGVINFYGAASANQKSIAANQFVDLVVTRNGTTKQVTVYVQGKQQVTFKDVNNYAALPAGSRVLRLFLDDSSTSGEDAAGTLDHVRTFKGVLTAKDAADLAAGKLPPNVRQK